MASFREVVQILITADGKQAVAEIGKVGTAAERDLQKATTGSKNLGDTFLKTGAVMVGAGAAIGLGIASTIRAAQESAIAQAKLKNSIANMPELVGASVSAFNNQATALQNVTVASDESVTSVQAMLGTFHLTQSEILGLTPLVVDFSRKFGIDLVSASKQVGKAMEGQISALQRAGIMIDKTAYSTDRFGAVMKALRENAGGFAAQEGKTFDGQVQILAHHFDEFKENVGAGAIAVANDLLPALNSVGVAFNNVDSATGGTAGSVVSIGAVAAIAGGSILLLAGAAIKLQAVLSGGLAAVSTFSSGVLDLVGGITVTTTAYEGFGATVAATDAEIIASSGGLAALAASTTAQGAASAASVEANTLLAGALGEESAAASAASQANAILGGSLTAEAEAALAATEANAALAASEAATAEGAAASTVAVTAQGAAAGGAATGMSALGAASLGSVAAIGAIVGVGQAAINALRDLTESEYAALTGVDELGQGVKIFGDILTAPTLGAGNFLEDIEYRIPIIGGMLKDLQQEARGFLHDLPVVGGLFKAPDSEKKKTNPDDDALKKATAAQKDSTQAQLAMAAATDGLSIAQERAKGSQESATKAIDAYAKSADDAAAKTQSYRSQVDSLYSAQFASTDAQRNLAEAMTETVSSTKDATQVQEDQQKAILDVGKAASDLAIQQLGPSASAAEKARVASEGQTQALDELKARYPAMGPFIDGYIAKQGQAELAAQSGARANDTAVAALDGLKNKYPELIPEIDRLEGKIKDFSAASAANDASNKTAMTVLDALKAKYPQLGAEIDHLIGKINSIPTTHNTDVRVNVDQAQVSAALSGFQSILGNFHPVITPHLASPTLSGGSTFGGTLLGGQNGRAKGGPLRKGQGATVGEEGEELFIPNAVRIPSKAAASAAKKTITQATGRAPEPSERAPKGVLRLTGGAHPFVAPSDGRVIPAPQVRDVVDRLGVDEDKIPRRARGGPLRNRETALVGEEGREVYVPLGKGDPLVVGQAGPALFTAPAAGEVFPHAQSERLLRSAGTSPARTRQPALPSSAPRSASRPAATAAAPPRDLVGAGVRSGGPAIGERLAPPASSSFGGAPRSVSAPRVLEQSKNVARMSVETNNATYNITVQAGIGNPTEIGKAAVEAITAYERRNGKGWRA